MNNNKIIRGLLLSLITSLLVACASTPDNSSPDLNKGLVAHWSMDQSQISGTTLRDSSGDYEGLLVGRVVPVDGRIGGALELDGETGYITFGNILNDVFSDQPAPGKLGGFEQAKKNWSKLLHLDGGGNQFSISIWVKPSKLNKNTRLLVKGGNTHCIPQKNERQLTLTIGDGKEQNNAVNLSASTLKLPDYVRVNSPKAPQVNEWTNIIYTYDESITTDPVLRFTLYLNGEKQPVYKVGSGGSSTFKIQPGDAALAIGVTVGSSGPCVLPAYGDTYYAGAVDDLRIYDRLLSAAEAKLLASMGQVVKEPVTTLTRSLSGNKNILVSVNQ